MAKIGFETFDRRGYPMVDARSGYGEWAGTYEGTVEDEMDLALLRRVTTVDWASADAVADLGCGTGRTGQWLHEQGARNIDGVDVTPEMLEKARARDGVFRSLAVADARESGLASGAYPLATSSLIDEHLADVTPLYAEAARLLRGGGSFVHVGFHPHFIMASGMPTHYDGADGPVAIETHVHHLSEQVTAGLAAGLQLAEMHERIIDDVWVELKPKWERYRGQPITFALVWRKP